jgi:hypothetical protein
VKEISTLPTLSVIDLLQAASHHLTVAQPRADQSTIVTNAKATIDRLIRDSFDTGMVPADGGVQGRLREAASSLIPLGDPNTSVALQAILMAADLMKSR